MYIIIYVYIFDVFNYVFHLLLVLMQSASVGCSVVLMSRSAPNHSAKSGRSARSLPIINLGSNLYTTCRTASPFPYDNC